MMRGLMGMIERGCSTLSATSSGASTSVLAPQLDAGRHHPRRPESFLYRVGESANDYICQRRLLHWSNIVDEADRIFEKDRPIVSDEVRKEDFRRNPVLRGNHSLDQRFPSHLTASKIPIHDDSTNASTGPLLVQPVVSGVCAGSKINIVFARFDNEVAKLVRCPGPPTALFKITNRNKRIRRGKASRRYGQMRARPHSQPLKRPLVRHIVPLPVLNSITGPCGAPHYRGH